MYFQLDHYIISCKICDSPLKTCNTHYPPSFYERFYKIHSTKVEESERHVFRIKFKKKIYQSFLRLINFDGNWQRRHNYLVL